jgi:dynein heavy chain
MFQMFGNIGSLRLGTDSQDCPITSAMISREGEVMQFQEAILTVGRVEDWMNAVLKGMRVANRYITKKAIYDYGKERKPR